MKKVYIYWVMIMLLGTAACNDDEFLTRVPHDQLTSKLYWRDVNDAESGLVAAYSQLESRSEFWDGGKRDALLWSILDLIMPSQDLMQVIILIGCQCLISHMIMHIPL